VGEVGAQPQSQNLAGLADPRIKLSVGLKGAPALTVAEFAQAPRQLAWGASVTVMPPLGQYSSARLVNLGYHRWAFKPEVGLSYPAGRWTIDGSAGVWLFTTNEFYFPGNARKEQDPVVALQGHVSYALPHRPGSGSTARGSRAARPGSTARSTRTSSATLVWGLRCQFPSPASSRSSSSTAPARRPGAARISIRSTSPGSS
jgi:hypothetical protein